jgi:hypothetical protein
LLISACSRLVLIGSAPGSFSERPGREDVIASLDAQLAAPPIASPAAAD